jgi:DNA gyrase subunit A
MQITPKRPNLTHLNPEVLAYIEALEAEIERLHGKSKRASSPDRVSEVSEDKLDTTPVTEPAEPPTTLNIITGSASGIAKRTARHLYLRQRRGGMGVFDLETPGDESPCLLAMADQAQGLLIITDHGRAFRMPVSLIPEKPVHSRGEGILERLNLNPDEHLAAILPDLAQGYMALVSQTGMIRMLRHHIFGEFMKPGTLLVDLKTFGFLAAACWTPGDGDLFIATRQGRAIRFSEKLVPPQGCLGIRISGEDAVAAITPVYPDSRVFLLGADGRGSLRLMEGFAPNKAPGAGGKIAFATDHLVTALQADEPGDIFIISRLSKIIRFDVSEVPEKDGVVQGVNCMSLRADETVACVISPSFK